MWIDGMFNYQNQSNKHACTALVDSLVNSVRRDDTGGQVSPQAVEQIEDLLLGGDRKYIH